LERAECWWRTRKSSWFGHQSWFVLGRVAFGVGLGIAGFSLSLTLSVTSRLLSSLVAESMLRGGLSSVAVQEMLSIRSEPRPGSARLS
jgi:hypothetical protein